MSEKKIKQESFKKWLCSLQANSIGTRRNVVSDFRRHFCYVIFHAKRPCVLNAIENGT